MKQQLTATLIIFSIWTVLNYFFHHIILGEFYTANEQLWLPLSEMKIGLLYGVNFISALLFVSIYYHLISKKTMRNAIRLGTLIGLSFSIVWIGCYGSMLVPFKTIVVWALAAIVNFIVAGGITGFFVKE